MRIEDWIAHLAEVYAASELPVRGVDGAANMIATTSQPSSLQGNMVFVCPSTEVGGESVEGGQVVVRSALVIVALRDVSDRFGSSAVLEDVIEATHAALVGWKPPDTDRQSVAERTMNGVRFVRGGVSAFQEKQLWWQMTFEVTVLRTVQC